MTPTFTIRDEKHGSFFKDLLDILGQKYIETKVPEGIQLNFPEGYKKIFMLSEWVEESVGCFMEIGNNHNKMKTEIDFMVKKIHEVFVGTSKEKLTPLIKEWGLLCVKYSA